MKLKRLQLSNFCCLCQVINPSVCLWWAKQPFTTRQIFPAAKPPTGSPLNPPFHFFLSSNITEHSIFATIPLLSHRDYLILLLLLGNCLLTPTKITLACLSSPLKMGTNGQSICKSPKCLPKLLWQQKSLSHKAQAAWFVSTYMSLLNTCA